MTRINNYHLVSWDKVYCNTKDGGPGVYGINDMNITLLGK